MTKDEALLMIEKAMIPTNKAMQQSQSNPVFLAQGSKLVAGHEGVFVEDKNLKEVVSYHETHCVELDNVIEQLQADNAKLRGYIKMMDAQLIRHGVTYKLNGISISEALGGTR